MSYLLAEDKQWIDLHMTLARTTDFEKYSDLVVNKKPVKQSLRDKFLEFCEPARKEDYLDFLKYYRLVGGIINRYYVNRNWNAEGNWFTLTCIPPMPIPELFGDEAINLIVPSSIPPKCLSIPRTFGARNGDNNIYFMNNYYYIGARGVATYADAV